MKKMTCREIGGVCDEEIAGETAEEVAQKSYEHIKGAGDGDHKNVKEMIDSSSEEDKSKWMGEFKGKFDAAPDA